MTMSKPTGTEAKASRGRIENERQVSEMATTKTATKTTKSTKTTRPAATKRAASTNGSKPTAPATATNAATPKPASTKAPKPMTTNEAVLRAWQHDYETRHRRVKRTA